MIIMMDNKESAFNVYRTIQLPHHYEDIAMIFVVAVYEPVLGPSAI